MSWHRDVISLCGLAGAECAELRHSLHNGFQKTETFSAEESVSGSQPFYPRCPRNELATHAASLPVTTQSIHRPKTLACA